MVWRIPGGCLLVLGIVFGVATAWLLRPDAERWFRQIPNDGPSDGAFIVYDGGAVYSGAYTRHIDDDAEGRPASVRTDLVVTEQASGKSTTYRRTVYYDPVGRETTVVTETDSGIAIPSWALYVLAIGFGLAGCILLLTPWRWLRAGNRSGLRRSPVAR